LSDVLHAQWSLCWTYLQVEYLSKKKNQKIRKQEEKQGTTPFFLNHAAAGRSLKAQKN
jgi:hypothetical protein